MKNFVRNVRTCNIYYLQLQTEDSAEGIACSEIHNCRLQSDRINFYLLKQLI